MASLRGELADALTALEQARAELAQARERIAELEARLRQTPRNSSRPPSSQGLDKPPPRPRSLRKKSGRKPGGQDGPEDTTLAQVARPDREVPHETGCCGRCGAGLAGRPVTGVERRQVFDLPEVAVTVTEHQLIERECGCGHRTRAAAPRGGEAPVQYGPRVAAIIVYLYAGQFLSTERTAQALAELFGIALSSGTVAGITARAAGRLDGFLAQVRDTIAAAEVAGFDETGFRVDEQAALGTFGFIVYSLPDRHRAVEAALSRGLPTVIIDAPRVQGSSHLGIRDRQAAEHLLRLGHRRIGQPGSPGAIFPWSRRAGSTSRQPTGPSACSWTIVPG